MQLAKSCMFFIFIIKSCNLSTVYSLNMCIFAGSK